MRLMVVNTELNRKSVWSVEVLKDELQSNVTDWTSAGGQAWVPVMTFRWFQHQSLKVVTGIRATQSLL